MVTNNNQKQIWWESQHYDFNPIDGKLYQKEKKNEDFETEPYDDLVNPDTIPMQIQQVSMTPFGFWKIDDSLHPMKQFQFWMGHTNFSIGDESREKIKRVPGVEVLKIISRYRFLIAIGKLFNSSDVMQSIQDAICGLDIQDIHLSDGKMLSEMLCTLKDNFDKWCIYVFPNGNYDYAGTKSSNDIQYNDKKRMLNDAHVSSGGIFITSSTKCNLI